MPFKKGDKVQVNGQLVTIETAFVDDGQPFYASYVNNDGADVFGTYWPGQITVGEPIHTSGTVQLIEAGDGVEHSTLGDIHDALAEVNAEIEAELDTKDA